MTLGKDEPVEPATSEVDFSENDIEIFDDA